MLALRLTKLCESLLAELLSKPLSMLELFYSNRHETLAAALFEDLDAYAHQAGDPFAIESVIVPSAALRRRLELDMAGRFGICANVEFCYLAQWLWAQIGRVLPVPARSPFSPDRLAWRCFRLFDDPALRIGRNG
jgi:exodeoxyribonuclease V gamma subunit